MIASLRFALGLLVLFAMVGLAQAADEPEDDDSEIKLTSAEVDAAIEQLADDKTRLPALERLLKFASMRYYQVGSVYFSAGNAEQDALMDRAVEAIRKSRDIKMVERALNAPTRTLQLWGLWSFPDPDLERGEPWKDILPQIQKLAVGHNPDIRGRAQERLFPREDQQEFLAKCLKDETSPDNIMQLLSYFDGRKYAEQVGPRILTLLKHDKPEIRLDALFFIGGNSNNAPMWQFKFDELVLAPVLELSHSKDDKERSAAVYALVDLRKQYPDAVRTRILELADDPFDDVRWRLAQGVREQQDRTDVQALLAKLLQDKSPLTRYFTILMVGPAKHVRELEELAAGPDKKVAEYAAGQLQGLRAKQP